MILLKNTCIAAQNNLILVLIHHRFLTSVRMTTVMMVNECGERSWFTLYHMFHHEVNYNYENHCIPSNFDLPKPLATYILPGLYPEQPIQQQIESSKSLNEILISINALLRNNFKSIFYSVNLNNDITTPIFSTLTVS